MRAVILAGGRGARDGSGEARRNPLLRRCEGETCGSLERQLQLLSEAAVPAVVVTGSDHRAVAPLVRRYGGETIFDGGTRDSSPFSLYCAARVFRTEETILLEGCLWIDRATLDAALMSEAHACLMDEAVSARDVLISGMAGVVEQFICDPLRGGYPANLACFAGRSQGIYHLRASTQFAQFLEEKREAETHIEAMNLLVSAEGMVYVRNFGLWRNVNRGVAPAGGIEPGNQAGANP